MFGFQEKMLRKTTLGVKQVSVVVFTEFQKSYIHANLNSPYEFICTVRMRIICTGSLD